ncbi:MAG: hypothetical protein RRY12_12525 [Cloacibacillus sp.]
MDNIYLLAAALHEAKAKEDAAKAARVALEEQLAVAIGVPEQWEGSKTNEVGEFKVSVKRTMNIKIDASRLRELAEQHDIDDAIMSTAFRWKPELNKKGWDSADDKIKAILSAAITKTPGKIGISVEIKNKEDK